MVRKCLQYRPVRFLTVNVSSAGVNFVLVQMLVTLGIADAVATPAIFFLCGQANFWIHDRRTFGDIFTTREGWQIRWMWFMPGSVLALLVNAIAHKSLVATPLPYWLAFAGAMAASGVFNLCWNFGLSHSSKRRCASHIVVPEVSPHELVETNSN